MTLDTVLMVLGFLMVASIVAIALVLKPRESGKDVSHARREIASGLTVAISMCVALCLAGCALRVAAVLHGMPPQESMPVLDMVRHVVSTPMESDPPYADVNGHLILYYRFDCPDCEAVYPALQDAFRGQDRVLWIATRSMRGEELAARYPVASVPSAVYVDYSGQPHAYDLLSTDGESPALDMGSVQDIQDLMESDAPIPGAQPS